MTTKLALNLTLTCLLTLGPITALSENSCKALFKANANTVENFSISATSFINDYIAPAVAALRAHYKSSNTIIEQFRSGYFHSNNSTNSTMPFPVVIDIIDGASPKPLNTVNVKGIVETSTDQPEGTSSHILFYDGDVFTADFYRRFGFGKKYTGIQLQEFTRNQAWMERVLDPTTNTYRYVIHSQHAGRRILEKLFQETQSPQITLYRGGSKGDFLFFKFIHDLFLNREIQSEIIDELLNYFNPEGNMKYTFYDLKKFKKILKNIDSSLKIAWAQRFLQQYELAYRKIFMSASEQAATRFSSGAMIAVTFSKNDLLHLYNSGNLYVGIEGQVEFSFFNQTGILSAIQQEINIFEPRYKVTPMFMTLD